MNNLKPKIMTDRKSFDKLNDNYLFISYSHCNQDEVYKVLDYLYANHVNYWYDSGLDLADKWDEVVKVIIDNPHCVGVIAFLSKDYIVSNACKKEYDEIKVLKKDLVIPALLDEGNSIKELYGSVPNESIKISNQEETFLFKDNVIFFNCKKDSPDKIIECLKNKTKGVLNNKEGFVQTLLEKKLVQEIDGSFIFKFGCFPQGNAISIYNRTAKNEIYIDEFDEKYYGCKMNGKYYPFEPIQWRILDVDDEYIYLVTHECLISSSGTKENINEKINKFYLWAFSEEDKINLDINCLDKNIIEKYKNQFLQEYKFSSLYCEGFNLFKIIWIINDNNITLMNSKLSQQITLNSSYSNTKAGVIPFIKVKINHVKSMFKEGKNGY